MRSDSTKSMWHKASGFVKSHPRWVCCSKISMGSIWLWVFLTWQGWFLILPFDSIRLCIARLWCGLDFESRCWFRFIWIWRTHEQLHWYSGQGTIFAGFPKAFGHWYHQSAQNFDPPLLGMVVWPAEPYFESWKLCMCSRVVTFLQEGSQKKNKETLATGLSICPVTQRMLGTQIYSIARITNACYKQGDLPHFAGSQII